MSKTPQKQMGMSGCTSPGNPDMKASVGPWFMENAILNLLTRLIRRNVGSIPLTAEQARIVAALGHAVHARTDVLMDGCVDLFPAIDVISLWIEQGTCPTNTHPTPLVELIDVVRGDNATGYAKVQNDLIAEIAGKVKFEKALKDTHVLTQLALVLLADRLVNSDGFWFLRSGPLMWTKKPRLSVSVMNIIAGKVGGCAPFFVHEDSDLSSDLQRCAKLETAISTTKKVSDGIRKEMQLNLGVDGFEKSLKQQLQVIKDRKVIEYVRQRFKIMLPVNVYRMYD